MKRACILFMILILLGAALCGYCSEDNTISVLYRGRNIGFDEAPYYSGGRIMAPVRAVHEALGSSVTWDDMENTATSVLGDKVLTMTLGSNIYKVNGEDFIMDAHVEMHADRIFAPVRYIATGFGKKISYHEYSQTAIISDVNEYSWFEGLTVPVPDFSWANGARFLSKVVLSDGCTEYSYSADENSLSHYLNFLQQDFGFEPYGMEYVSGGVNYSYVKDNMLIGISDLSKEDGSHTITIIPDVYGQHSIGDNGTDLTEEKREENSEENKEAVIPDILLPEEKEDVKLPENDSTYDDVDYGKITKSELLDVHTSEGKTFYVYSYDMFSESYYESYIESKGWIFYDFKFDIDSFSNTKYWVNGERVLCVSVSHIYGIVMVSVLG